MITRKKRIGLDSSPKSAICKNIHLLSKDTINDTVNLLRTPERPHRFNKKLNNIGNDESPILSQEPVGITWKWANEGTPIRTTNKTSKLRATKQQSNEQMDTSLTIPLNLRIEPETHSPKGLYKFKEEMRKIRFDTESDNVPCANISDLNISSTPTTTNAKDTGYPKNIYQFISTDKITNNDKYTNYNNNIHGSATVMSEMKETIYATTATTSTKNNENNQHTKCDDKQIVNDSLVNDLLNDSDFDQMLLTCSERVENPVIECSQSSGKDVNTRPEQIKIGSGSSSEWNLFIDDDGADDLLSNIDIDIPISDSLNNSKFMRHKSMPQPQPKLSSSNVPVLTAQPNQLTGRFKPAVSRKIFTRHESFPITNSFQNRAQKPYAIGSTQAKNSNPVSQKGSQRCTNEEIAEKRRQAIERLKNRNKVHKIMNMPPKR